MSKTKVTLVVVIALICLAILAWYLVVSVFKFSEPASNSAQLDRISALISDAVPVDTVEITGCIMKPAKISFLHGSTVKFVNKDATDHIIWLDPQNYFVALKKTTTSESFSFWDVPGIRYISCDDKKDIGLLQSRAD